MSLRFFVTGLLLVLLAACKKDPNPYSTYIETPPVIVKPTDTLDPNSFVGIHYNVFKPTCANSGCHDGTFEPDFRTVESAYNTLVYQPVKNAVEDYVYRVEPKNADRSILYKRLTTYFEGTQGIMPIQTDPNSDWPTKKDQYIQNIKNWINNGAKDQFGSTPSLGNLEPVFKGVMAYGGTSTTELNRKSGKSSIIVPQNVSKATFYFSLDDDTKPAAQLSYNKMKISTDPFSFESKPELDLTIGTAVSGTGYFNDQVEYTHRIELDMAQFAVDQKYFLRIYVSDGGGKTEMPKDGSADYIKHYFSFIRQ